MEELLHTDRRAFGRVPRDVRIAAFERAKELVSDLDPEGERASVVAHVYLRLADALPLGRRREAAELAEAALAYAHGTRLRAAAYAHAANARFRLSSPEEAWPHVAAGLAAASQLMSSDEPSLGDEVALELLAAVGFSAEPAGVEALYAALGLAAFYDEDRVPAILVALAEESREDEPELARDCAVEAIRRALPAGNEWDTARGWYELAWLADKSDDPRASTLAALAHDGAERLGREEYTWLPSVWKVEHETLPPAEQEAAREEIVNAVVNATYAAKGGLYEQRVERRLQRRSDERSGWAVEEARSYCRDLLADLRERGYR